MQFGVRIAAFRVGLHGMTRTAYKKKTSASTMSLFGWWQPCAQRLRKRLCVMCSASHDAIAKCQHSDCLASAKIRQKKAFVKSILRKVNSFLALTIEIRQKKCRYLKKSTFQTKVYRRSRCPNQIRAQGTKDPPRWRTAHVTKTPNSISGNGQNLKATMYKKCYLTFWPVLV